jgi:hypothetical protein
MQFDLFNADSCIELDILKEQVFSVPTIGQVLGESTRLALQPNRLRI